MTVALRRAGIAVVGLYTVVAPLTHGLSSGGGTRPLFDGFAPPVPYRWVRPPPELAAGNVPPEPAERTVPLTERGSEPANASTTDAQIILTLPERAITPRPPDTAVLIRLVPLDAGTLARVPADVRVVGNAYRVTLLYQPSQAPATEIAATAFIALTASSQGDTLLYLPDGQQVWQTLDSRPFGATHGVIGRPPGPGTYLVAASPKVTAPITSTPGPGGGSGGVGIVIAGVVAIAVIVVAGFALRSRQQEQDRRRRRGQRARSRGRSRGGRKRP